MKTIRSAEEIASDTVTPYAKYIWPDTEQIFFNRKQRVIQLAANDPHLQDYLLFLGHLVEAQHRLMHCQHKISYTPPLSVSGAPLANLTLAEDFRLEFDQLLKHCHTAITNINILQSIQAIEGFSDEILLDCASRVLTVLRKGSNALTDIDAASFPFLASALQVYFLRRVAALKHAQVQLAYQENTQLCPCCSSLPIASLKPLNQQDLGSRYLLCGLCQTQWHYERIKCLHCTSSVNIAYHALTAEDTESMGSQERSAIRAEVCDDCHHYSKLFALEKAPLLDVFADDVVSLPLDLLVQQAQYSRVGVNYLMWFGNVLPQQAPEHLH